MQKSSLKLQIHKISDTGAHVFANNATEYCQQISDEHEVWMN